MQYTRILLYTKDMIHAHRNRTKPYIALLGGSFNPPHVGHFRIALEIREAFCPETTLLIPVADPPHKIDADLLPFSLRAAMLEAVAATLPGLEVCRIEAERSGPSYTVDTLIALHERRPDCRLLFILGDDNFSLLPTWHRGLELPVWADLVVLPRVFWGNGARCAPSMDAAHTDAFRGASEEDFCRTALSLWPEAEPSAPPCPAVTKAFRLTVTRSAYFVFAAAPAGNKFFTCAHAIPAAPAFGLPRSAAGDASFEHACGRH